MGFLAFLLIGGISGASAWIFYPGGSKKRPNPATRTSNLQGLLVSALLGFMAATLVSYVGQYLNLFQAGQMLEWASAILASCIIGCIYTVLAK